ncbi:MAG: hypothetical protein PHD15_03130 [Clostridia bacterium]|nr:hypothetical protein [Clostridia bacterium]MDD4386737.1 hypothetical protein [Clostridia bacterium]
MKKSKGISLIVLVITIIVIIILAGAVILSLANNNPIESANEAVFKSNVAEYNSELAMAITNEYLQDNSFDSATFDVGVWDGTGDGTGTIKEYITSMSEVDAAKYEIQQGKLVYVGNNESEEIWATQVGITLDMLEADLLKSLVWLKTTDMITDFLADSTTLANGGVTGYPYGRVLWNYNLNTNQFSNFTNNPRTSMLSNAIIEIALLDAYQHTNDIEYLSRAIEIGDQINGSIVSGTSYGNAAIKLLVTQRKQSTGWANDYEEVYIQDIALAAIAQLKIFTITENHEYENTGIQLMNTLGWLQDTAYYSTIAGGGTLPNVLEGGFPEFFSHAGDNVFYPSLTTYSLGNADMIVSAFQTAFEVTGNTEYTSRLEWYTYFMNNMLNSQGCMNAAGYIYEYYADKGDGWMAQNWDQIDNNWGSNEPFTTDMFFYSALGIAKINRTLGTQILAKADEMQENNLFYGQYNMDGTPDLKNDDNTDRLSYFENINIGMYLELQNIINKNETHKISDIKRSIISVMVKDATDDKNAQYAFEWSNNSNDGIIESIATGRIISSILK